MLLLSPATGADVEWMSSVCYISAELKSAVFLFNRIRLGNSQEYSKTDSQCVYIPLLLHCECLLLKIYGFKVPGCFTRTLPDNGVTEQMCMMRKKKGLTVD